MSRILTMAVALVFVGAATAPTRATAADAKVIQINGMIGTSTHVAQATNNGTTFVGTGKLTSANGTYYVLRITSGEVIQGHYVRLQGTISSSSGAASPFTLVGDSVSGAFVLTYTGSNGGTFKMSGKGSVVIQ